MNDNNIEEGGVSPRQIFECMKKNVYNNFYTYSYSSLNKEYLYSRKALFSILHKITIKMGFKSQTFFLSALYLDIIFSQRNTINISLNVLGLASLSLSAKYVENDPTVPHLQYFMRIYNNLMGYKNMISVNDLRIGEVIILKILNYKLNYFTVYDFNSFLFSHGVVKLEQLKDIDSDTNHHYCGNRRNGYILSQSESYMIKYILENIYKKSRNFLDIITYNTKLCFKYDALILSVYIMKKSVMEILAKEQKIILYDKREQEEFYKKNLYYFRQIMHNLYRIDFEENEQYKELLVDEEVQEIFENNEKSNEFGCISAIGYKISEKKEDENENNNFDLNKINKNNDNRSIFTSSVTSGFYRKLKLGSNLEEISKVERNRDRSMVSSRKERKEIINNFDDITLNKINVKLNKNSQELHSYKKRELKKRILSYSNRSACNISLLTQEKEKEKEKDKDKDKEQPKYNVFRKISNISSVNNNDNDKNNNKNNHKIFQRIETCDNKIDINHSINPFKGSNYCLSKKVEIKTEKNSPLKFGETLRPSKNNNLDVHSRMNSNSNITSRDKKNERKSIEKRTYIKNIFQSNISENYSTLTTITRNGIGSNLTSTNITSDVESSKKNYNNNENKNSNFNSYYNNRRINVRKNTVVEKHIDISTLNSSVKFRKESSIKSNNNVNESKYQRRLYPLHLNNNNNDLSVDKRSQNAIISKYSSNINKNNNTNNNRKVIEPYSQQNSNNTDNKNNAKHIYRFMSNNSVFENKVHNNLKTSAKDVSYDNTKGITSRYFYRYNRSKINRNSEIKNSEDNKSFIGTKRKITFILGKQNNEINSTLKEINKYYTNKSKKEETKNDNNEQVILGSNKEVVNNIKVNYTKSIRQKYLNSKNSNNSVVFNTKQNSKTLLDKDEKSSNNNYLNNNHNSISISIRKKYSKINVNKNHMVITDNNMKNNVASSSKISEEEKKNNTQKLSNSSIFGMINKTKTLFKRNSKEEEEQNDKNNLERKIYNNTNINFYKSQNNFMEKINKEEINKKQQEKKLGSSYIRNIMSNNKLDKDKKDKKEINHLQSQKNSTTLRINNSIRLNNENSNNNISNKLSKYKKLYQRNNTNSLNNNDILLTSKNDISNNISKITESKNSNTNNNNDKITYKFPFYRRTYGTNLSKNANSYHTTIFKKK